MTDTAPGGPPNQFESDKPGTEGRSRSEARIEDLRRQGGVFVEAVRATRMPMVLTDPALPGNPIVFANQSFLELSGYSLDELLGQQPHFMNGPDTDPEDAERFRRILEQDCDNIVETVQYAKGGRRFVATVLLSAFKEEAGHTLHQFLSWADVTRRVDAEDAVDTLRETQAALQESESKYRVLFESMDEGFCIIEVLFDEEGRPVDYRFLESNPAFERQSGLVGAIGRTVSEVVPEHAQDWLDIYGRIVRTGEAERFDDAAATLDRWYDVYAFPVGEAEEHRVAVLFRDVTPRKRAERALQASEERQRFLLKLSDALHPLGDAAEIQATTARLLGEHLGVDRAMYGEVEGEPGAEIGTIRGQYVRPSTGGAAPPAPFPERFTFEPFGAHTMAARYRGEALVVADVGSDPAFSDAERAAWSAAGVCAAVVAPLAKHGRLVAEFGIHSATPRAWSDAEVALVQEVGERTWAAAERARAEAALRESEDRYRALFESMDEAYSVVEVLKNDAGEWSDFRFLEVNPAFIAHTNMRHPVGRTATEILGTPNPRWAQLYGEALDTGKPLRVEESEPMLGLTFDLNIFALDRDRNRVAVLFTDVTERRRSEEALRETKERQAFLLDLSDALRAEPNVDAMALFALRSLAERLQLDRCYISEYRLDADRGDLPYQVGNDRVPPLPESIRLSDFPEALKIARGGTLVIDNVAEAEFLSDADKRNIQGLGMGALATAATRKGENLPLFAIVAVSATPREWTPGEIALIEEVNERTWAAVERARAEDHLRESEEKLRVIVENARDYAIFTTDPEGRVEQWHPGAETVFGWTAEEAAGQPMEITFTSEDRALGAPRMEREQAAREGRAPNVRWHVRKDGSRVFIYGISTALKAPDGNLQGFLKIGQDVTERKWAEEHQRTLLAELQHRVRNTLGVVRSIARRTAERSATVEDMYSHFQGRLDAFSRVQSIVTRNPEAGIDLESLIEDELLAHAAREGEALTVQGPEISLKARAAESLSLAIHELATNAVKYGALSAERGRVAVRWERVKPDGTELLHLAWEEHGVDMQPGPPARQGFGLELLQRSLPYDLRAQTRVEFRPGGLRFEMTMPLGPDVLAN